jgi:tyrosine-protein kinase Etk/Wzc
MAHDENGHNGNKHNKNNGALQQGGRGTRRPAGPAGASERTAPLTSGGNARRNARRNGAEASEATLQWGTLWHTLRRGWWIIVLTAALVTGGVTAYTLQMDPVYQSASVASINAQSRQPAGLALADEQPALGSVTLSGEVGFLKNSVALAERVVNRLQEAADALGTDEHFPLLDNELSTRERARRLMERVSFVPSEEEEMIQIQAESTAPEEAASIANFYAKEYKRISQEQSRERVAAAKEFLQEQVEKRGKELRELETQLGNFAREKQVPTEGQGGERLIAEYRSLRQQRDQAQFDLRREKSSLQLLQQQLAQAKPDLEEKVLQQGEASELQERIDALNQRLADLKAQTEEYYAVDSTRRGRETNIEELESLKDRIAHFKERKRTLTNRLVERERNASSSGGSGKPLGYVAQLKSRIAETKLNIREMEAQVATLNDRLSTYDGRLQSLPQQSIKRGQLERKIARAERWYNSFVERLQKMKVAEESELGNVRVVRKAMVPSVPVRPDVTQNIILGLLLGLGFGVGLAFIRGASDRRLTGPEDVEAHGYNLVGVIPEMQKEIKASFDGREVVKVEGQEMSTSLMTVLNPLSPVAENFRLIRTNLQHVQENGSPLRTLLVTSPGPAEGKSMTSINLAVAMAQGGRRTLLIDADLRRPNAHSLLGTPLQPGLADLLIGRHRFHPENFKTTVEGLSLLPAGKREEQVPTELFESERMESLMANLRQYYDVVIVDSPPVLAVTDAMVLATHSDAAVVVASANETDERALQVTQDRLHAVGTRVVGAIVNRVDAHGSSFQSYGYEYYGSYADPNEA